METPDTSETEIAQQDSAEVTPEQGEAVSTEVSDDTTPTDVPEVEAEEDVSQGGEDEAATTDDAQPEPETVASPLPQPEPARRSVMPMIFAGIIVALAGFFAARSDILEPYFPNTKPTEAVVEQLNGKVDDLTARLDDATGQIATLTSKLENQPAPETDFGPLEQQIADLSDRIDALGSAPATAAIIPDAAIDAALAELRSTAATQQAELDRLLSDARLARENAEASASATLARAAVNRVLAAVDNGGPFATALGDLEQAGVTDIPDALRAAAADGVQPLSNLQAAAPDAARAALAAARTAEGGGGLGAFFERQLGTRSILPREGSDPDAVLSRIEAATRDGRLGDALAEAEALPEDAQAALGPWLEQAQQRHEAVTAANALAERLSAL